MPARRYYHQRTGHQDRPRLDLLRLKTLLASQYAVLVMVGASGEPVRGAGVEAGLRIAQSDMIDMGSCRFAELALVMP